MKAKMSIKMDRPIDPSKHFLIPGRWEVIADGRAYRFDFREFEGHISEDEADVISFTAGNEDISHYPEIRELRKHLHQVTSLSGLIYTGDDEDSEIHPVGMLSFLIIDYGPEDSRVFDTTPTSTEFVKVTDMSSAGRWEYWYDFQPCLLDGMRWE